FSAKTRGTSAAVYGRIERDAIALGELRNARAECGDDARRFVAHHDGRNAATGGAIVAVNVTAANATSRDANQHLSWAGLRNRQVGDLQLAVLGKEQCFHVRQQTESKKRDYSSAQRERAKVG